MRSIALSVYNINKTISHNNANSQVQKSHYNAIAKNISTTNIAVMKKSDILDSIAVRHRAAIKSIMAKHKLKMSPWCTKAGISESTLRNFLSGASESMGANNLELLSKAAGITIGELLGEKPLYYSQNQPTFSDKDKGVLTAILSIVTVLTQNHKRKLDEVDFVEVFSQQIKTFRLNNQQDAAEVMSLLLKSLNHRPPVETAPNTAQIV